MAKQRQIEKWGVVFAIASSTVLLGCEEEIGLLKRYGEKVYAQVGTQLGLIPASPEKKAGESDSNSELLARLKANSELLREMMKVVYDREPKDPAEFGTYLNALNQGASLEGVYNGFTHSSVYRKYEIGNPGHSQEALKFFSEELAAIQGELKTPSTFSEKAARPLAVPVQPGIDPGSSTSGDTPNASSVKKDRKEQIEEYAKKFKDASIYTLKRVLADEVLKLIDEKAATPELLAAWYGSWVVRMSGRKVDFGLDLRNRPDESFHRQFALKAPRDRLQWETLNRVHRIFNEANRKKP